MKVLWICGSEVIGGAETTTVTLLQRLRARGHDVQGLCRDDGRVAATLAAEGMRATTAAVGGNLNVRAIGAITEALRTARPDVAVVTTVDDWVWTCLARRPSGTRLVLVRHMALPLSRPVLRLAAWRAHAVVAVSESVQRILLAPAVLAPERVHVIANPVRFTPRADLPSDEERRAARLRLGLDADGAWVGFFGGLRPEKGIRDVCQVVRRANEAVGPTNLLICGRASVDGNVLSPSGLAAAYSLKGRLHHLGEITAVKDALTAVDVVVLATPQRLSEASPATLAEAMACGTPVMAYVTGGVAEILGEDGEAGFAVRADDPDDLTRVLIRTLSDRIEARRRAETALKRVQALFGVDAAAERYERLFESLRSGPPTA